MNIRAQLRILVESLPETLLAEALNRMTALMEHPDEPYDLSEESEKAVQEALAGEAEIVTGAELRANREKSE